MRGPRYGWSEGPRKSAVELQRASFKMPDDNKSQSNVVAEPVTPT